MDSSPPTTTRNPWVVLASTSLAVFAVFLDTTILFVAFPSISKSFPSTSASTMSWVLNGYTIVFAALLIPAGKLADRVGRRKTFLSAVVVFTVASMLCGLAPTAGLLIAARILQAIGAAALVPASLAMVLQTFSREKVPVAIAIWGAFGAVAGAAGPTLGAFVVENFGWRWAFYINLPVGIISFVLGWKVLPEGKEANPGRLPDGLSIGLLVSGLALAAYGIVHTSEWGWASAAFIGSELVAAAIITAFILRCRQVTNPLLDLRLFQSPSFRWANAGMFAYAIGFNAMFLGNVLFLTDVWGYSIMRAGMGIAVGPLIVAVAAPLFGKFAARIGQRALLIPGGLIWASGPVYLLLRDHHAGLRRRLPPIHRAHRDRRGARAAAAVLGVGQGPPVRPVRLGIGGQPGDAQPRRDARRGPRGRPDRRAHHGQRARRVPQGVVVDRGQRGHRHRPEHAAAQAGARPSGDGGSVAGGRGDGRAQGHARRRGAGVSSGSEPKVTA